MNKPYFTPVDFDALYPSEAPVPETPAMTPEVKQAKAEAVYEAVRKVNMELTGIRTGESQIVKQAIQFTPEKTPFCINLERIRVMAKQENLSKTQVLQLVALARQDFGEIFATFVLEQFKEVFAGDK